jgi:hypothetical protein
MSRQPWNAMPSTQRARWRTAARSRSGKYSWVATTRPVGPATWGGRSTSNAMRTCANTCRMPNSRRRKLRS